MIREATILFLFLGKRFTNLFPLKKYFLNIQVSVFLNGDVVRFGLFR